MFVAKYETLTTQFTNLCLGIDPSASTLDKLRLKVSYEGLYEFTKRLVDVYVDDIGIVKPQTAFFEQYGYRGIKLLEDTTRELREAGKIVIIDSKRGDIGSSNDGYAKAYLTIGSPLECDALTTVSYFGLPALYNLFDIAKESGKVVFVVAVSSNSEGINFQNSRYNKDLNLSQYITTNINEYNRDNHCYTVGSVIGSTRSDVKDTLNLESSYALMPGIGVQGATFKDFINLSRNINSTGIPNVSRAVTNNGFSKFDIKNSIKNLISNYKESL